MPAECKAKTHLQRRRRDKFGVRPDVYKPRSGADTEVPKTGTHLGGWILWAEFCIRSASEKKWAKMARWAHTISCLLAFWALPCLAANSKKTCEAILAEKGIEDVFSTQPHLRRALEIVLNKRLARNAIPPIGEPISETKISPDTAFTKAAPLRKPEVVFPGTVDWEDAGAGIEDVFRVQHDGATYFFRPIWGGFNTGTQARKTMAASALNQALKLTTMPRARWSEVNEELGALSDEATGIPFTRLRDYKSILGQLTQYYPHLLADLGAFEFLIGNLDAVRRNTMIDTDQLVLSVFDHDNAFIAGLVAVRGPTAEDQREILFGVDLPEQYTAHFVAGLKELTAAKIKALLSPYLSQTEIDGVLFRREIILEDLKLRKPTLLLVP